MGRVTPTVKALALATIAMAGSSCAPDEGNILSGTWRMSYFLCDDTRYEVTAGTQFDLIYGEQESFTSRLTDTGTPCNIDVTGTYSRSGLTVKETVTDQDCGTGCTISAIPPVYAGETCAGSSSFSELHHTSFVSMGADGVLSQTRHSPAQFCPSGTDTEEQVFTRID